MYSKAMQDMRLTVALSLAPHFPTGVWLPWITSGLTHPHKQETHTHSLDLKDEGWNVFSFKKPLAYS